LINGSRIIDIEICPSQQISTLTCPVLEGMFDEVAERNHETPFVLDLDYHVCACDLFDPSPFSLKNHYIIDTDRFTDGNLHSSDKTILLHS
jgi:hypothetical protein